MPTMKDALHTPQRLTSSDATGLAGGVSERAVARLLLQQPTNQFMNELPLTIRCEHRHCRARQSAMSGPVAGEPGQAGRTILLDQPSAGGGGLRLAQFAGHPAPGVTQPALEAAADTRAQTRDSRVELGRTRRRHPVTFPGWSNLRPQIMTAGLLAANGNCTPWSPAFWLMQAKACTPTTACRSTAGSATAAVA